MNIDYIVRMLYTDPRNKGKSIRHIARAMGLNPGTLYRILRRLDLLPPGSGRNKKRPDSPFDPAPDPKPVKSPRPGTLPRHSLSGDRSPGTRFLDEMKDELETLMEIGDEIDKEIHEHDR
jgi:transposase-like protein